MNELSLEIVKVDWDLILDNVYRPAIWNKTWNIFRYGDLKISMHISSIFPPSESVNIMFITEYKDLVERNVVTINYNKDHRNHVVIQNSVYRVLLSEVIDYLEKSLIRETDEYESARILNGSRKGLVRDLAIERLDDLGIKDEEVRDIYIEKMLDNDQYDKTKEVYRELELTKLYAEALALTTYFRPEKYDELRLRVLVKLEQEDEWIDEFKRSIDEELAAIEVKDMETLRIELEEIEEE